MKKDKRANIIEKSMRITWFSLKSHMGFTHKLKLGNKETKKWHKDCIRMYSKILSNLSKLY